MSASKNSPLKPDTIIPIRRVPLSDHSQLPPDYSATPGGTLYSTTPGGTRIIYEREFLLQCRNSPLTKSPPPNLPNIPGVTQPINNIAHRENLAGGGDKTSPKKVAENTDEGSQFHMDI